MSKEVASKLHYYTSLFGHHVDSINTMGDGYVTFTLNVGGIEIRILSKRYNGHHDTSCQYAINGNYIQFDQVCFEEFSLFIRWQWPNIQMGNMLPRFMLVINDDENIFTSSDMDELKDVEEDFHKTLDEFIKFVKNDGFEFTLMSLQNMRL
jgi:hypothetical protein